MTGGVTNAVIVNPFVSVSTVELVVIVTVRPPTVAFDAIVRLTVHKVELEQLVEFTVTPVPKLATVVPLIHDVKLPVIVNEPELPCAALEGLTLTIDASLRGCG